jgi:hypothetical protein
VAFIAPLRESNCWDVKDPDISGSGARHVRPTSLEPSLETGYVRPEDLVVEESG